MGLREEYRVSHPDFPWLSASDPGPVAALLARNGWLEPGEQVRAVAKAGEGNMNLSLRVDTDRRSVVLKQARPWVEKYDMIAAPWDRSLHEQRFYQRVRDLAKVASRMPRLLGADAQAHALLLEFCPGASDLSSVYAGDRLTRDELETLADYLAALHRGTRGQPEPDFANVEMRRLNHEHIYRLPLAGVPGMDLERFEPGLTAAAQALREDPAYVEAVHRTGERYLGAGPSLLHGDYFPGSWLRTDPGLRVIDPEFCFYGDPEFDLGCVAAHLALSGHARTDWDAFANAYRSSTVRMLDTALTARFAGAEVMRRLLGVAQLPIPPSTDRRRAHLLERSRTAVLDGNAGSLWR